MQPSASLPPKHADRVKVNVLDQGHVELDDVQLKPQNVLQACEARASNVDCMRKVRCADGRKLGIQRLVARYCSVLGKKVCIVIACFANSDC